MSCNTCQDPVSEEIDLNNNNISSNNSNDQDRDTVFSAVVDAWCCLEKKKKLGQCSANRTAKITGKQKILQL